MNIFKKIVLMLLIATFLITACGGGKSPQDTVPAIPKLDPAAIISKGRAYYKAGVDRETNITVLWRKYEVAMNTFRLGAKDLIGAANACSASVATTESTIGNAVTGNMSGDAIFSALVTNSVSGEQATTECAQIFRQLADYIVANRAATANANLMAFEAATEYMNYTSSFPEVDIMNDLMQTYGDTAIVYQKLADNGIGATDWSWLPTANLWVSHSDQKLCQYYISGEFMANVTYSTKLKFTGHETALARLYESTWNPAANGGKGECRMTRYAALEYMTRSILSSDTQNIIQTGEDQSLFESTPTPAP